MPLDTLYCFRAPDGNMSLFYPHPEVVEMGLWADEPGDILHVRLVPDENGDYWCWHGAKDDDYQFVYPSKMLLGMIFSYGMKTAVDAGEGVPVQVRVEQIGEPIPRKTASRQ